MYRPQQKEIEPRIRRPSIMIPVPRREAVSWDSHLSGRAPHRGETRRRPRPTVAALFRRRRPHPCRRRPRLGRATASGRSVDLTAGRGSCGARVLDRRAGNSAERAEDAAVARVRAKHRAAALAVIEKLAGVGWHRFGLDVPALRACQGGSQFHEIPFVRSAGQRPDQPLLSCAG